MFPHHCLDRELLKELITFLGISGATGTADVVPQTLCVISFVGKTKPLGEVFPDMVSDLIPICKRLIDIGTPKQAKNAVKCLVANVAVDQQEAVFAEILEKVKENLNPELGEK